MEIAIIGMACRVPGAADLDAFWRNLVEGRRSRTDLVLDDPGRVPVGYLLDGVEDFDAGLFGLTPAQAALTDPQHRLFLELCHAALENAGWDPAKFGGDIGVYGGRGMETYRWRHIFANRAVMAVSDHTTIGNGNHADALTTLVSYQLNLRGPSVGVYTACSTSLVAVHMAAEALRAGECDMALAGGVNIELPGDQGYVYREGGMESADGDCNPFDAGASGTVAGSGGGIVLLKRLDDALADGDNVRAVILGNAVNNDGASKVGFTAASVTGQAVAIANALANAGVDARTIGYVETSATGSPVGDALEVEALTSVFGRAPAQQWCAIGSVKSNIGHLSQGAGVIGLIKTVLSLEHGLIPPSLGFDTPNPAIDFDNSPFYVNASLSKWERGAQPRRAGVSSFGIGGTNAHVILEEVPPQPPSVATDTAPLMVSARSEKACEIAATRLLQSLERPGLVDVAYTLRAGRVDYPHRIAILGDMRRISGVATDPPPDVVFVFRDEGPDWFTRGYEAALGWQEWGVQPTTMIGHGAAELIAATLAGVLDLDQARELAASGACDVRPAEPRLPFFSGRTARPITVEQATDPAYWTSLLSAPTKFGECMAAVKGAQVLKGPRTPEAAARLWVRGVPVDLRLTGRRVPLPGYPYERTRHWIEPDSVAPQQEAEKPDGLEGIWKALLGHENIGPDSEFFDLGGTSLTAVQLIAQVQAQFGVRLSMRNVFDGPTVREMEETITRLQARTAASRAT